MGNEQLPEDKAPSAFSSPSQKRPSEAIGAASREHSRICAPYSMTRNERIRVAFLIGAREPRAAVPGTLCPAERRCQRQTAGKGRERGEFVMELRVQLKVCEGCGCLWYRAQTQGSVYCNGCEEKLRDFPTPESRKRRGRPARKTLGRVWAAAEAIGGAQ